MITTPNKSDRLEFADALKDHIVRSKMWLNPLISFIELRTDWHPSNDNFLLHFLKTDILLAYLLLILMLRIIWLILKKGLADLFMKAFCSLTQESLILF